MRTYELTYIIHPDLDDTAFKELIETIAGWITSGGGKVVKSDVWGKRKMAYQVRKQKEGNYVHLQIELEGSQGAEIERQMGLQESVMRYLLIATEEEKQS